MPKSNSQQKSTPDALIRHQQVEANGEEWAALFRVRTRLECPEDNRRELTCDSNLNCGIAQKREKINQPEHTACQSQNKRTEQFQRRASRWKTGPSPPDAGGSGERKGANSAPETSIPYHTANRPPVSNQRFPEILDGQHPPGGSRLEAAPENRHKAQAPDWHTPKLRLGPRRGEGGQHPGRVHPSSSWLPELLGQGRHKTQAQPSPRFCGEPESWNHTQGGARSI